MEDRSTCGLNEAENNWDKKTFVNMIFAFRDSYLWKDWGFVSRPNVCEKNLSIDNNNYQISYANKGQVSKP